jgi:4-hydroxybenzoyl-CoA reductase beta subunit
LEETLEWLSEHGERTAVLAGGTDLLVRIKQRLIKPLHLVSLKKLGELSTIDHDKKGTTLGAMTPLFRLMEEEKVRAWYPALVKAVRLIGAPPIQHFRGTIGGNLCLQTRCLFYNQSDFWRSGRSRCHKDGGQICYAEENSDRCRSANQSDGACALTALGAMILLASKRGQRRLPIEAFFTGKGEKPFALEPDELVTQIHLPWTGKGSGSGFEKLTFRTGIDFALVSSAVWLKVEEERITDARIAVGGAGAAPLLLKEAAEGLMGCDCHDAGAIERAAAQVEKHASAFMVDNLGATLEYRRKVVAVTTKRAIREAILKAEEGMRKND